MHSLELALGLALGFTSLAERQTPPELLPPPQEVQPETILLPPSPIVTPIHIDPFYQPDPYWRMRLYARDRYGYLRPRVIYSPHGAYYPLTGEPYPYTPIKGIP